MTKVEEPEWDRQMRALVLGLDQHDAELCGCGCGYPAAVSQAPENEGRFGTKPPIRCHARTAAVLGKKQYEDESIPASEALLFDRPVLQRSEAGASQDLTAVATPLLGPGAAAE